MGRVIKSVDKESYRRGDHVLGGARNRVQQMSGRHKSAVREGEET